MPYCILNTERRIVIKRAKGRSTFESQKEAQNWLDDRDNPSHLKVMKLVEPDSEE